MVVEHNFGEGSIGFNFWGVESEIFSVSTSLKNIEDIKFTSIIFLAKLGLFHSTLRLGAVLESLHKETKKHFRGLRFCKVLYLQRWRDFSSQLSNVLYIKIMQIIVFASESWNKSFEKMPATPVMGRRKSLYDQ